MKDTMRAMAVAGDGPRLAELPRPVPGPTEVRVRVVSAAINAAEQKLVDGEFVGRFLHAKSEPLVLGWDFSGTIDATGESVADLDVGTEVWGHLAYSPSQRQGTYAEFITVPRAAIAEKSASVSHDTAAATATCAMTALQSLRDLGGAATGTRVLIIGAAGGIGSIGVGIAKRLGAHVTAVCSTKDVERVAAMGADAVVDRRKEDPLAAASAYDVILDTPAVMSFHSCAKSLRPGGTYVTTLPDAGLVTGMVRALFSSKRVKFVQVASRSSDLELVGSWLEDGLEMAIDSRYPVSELGAALARQRERGRVGRVVVGVDGGW